MMTAGDEPATVRDSGDDPADADAGAGAADGGADAGAAQRRAGGVEPGGGGGRERLLIVDAANVVGSVPDGWWRDRAGAAGRLRDALVPVASGGLASWPPPLEVVLVVEGAARDVPGVEGVRVVAAPRSGDDTIVELVEAAAPEREVAVVTADRGLRARVRAAGATVLGPRSVPRRPRRDSGPEGHRDIGREGHHDSSREGES